MDDDALVAWVGDDFPSPLERILGRFEPGCEPEILVEQGWWPLLVRLDVRLSGIVPDYALRSVRPTDGRLHFAVAPLSIEHAPRSFLDAIRDAEEESQHTCEVCGRPGQTVMQDGGGYAVLCAADAGFSAGDPSSSSFRRRSLT